MGARMDLGYTLSRRNLQTRPATMFINHTAAKVIIRLARGVGFQQLAKLSIRSQELPRIPNTELKPAMSHPITIHMQETPTISPAETLDLTGPLIAACARLSSYMRPQNFIWKCWFLLFGGSVAVLELLRG